MTERRRLSAGCYGASVRRAQAALEPLPQVVGPDAMARVTAPTGRCDVCGLERAEWAGEGVRLCEACYQREARRRVQDGEEVAEGQVGTFTQLCYGREFLSNPLEKKPRSTTRYAILEKRCERRKIDVSSQELNDNTLIQPY